MTGIAVQPSKVQRPPLRAETLARHRLLDWLHVQIHHRVVLVIAEAGYGKTTLLTDFSGRTRLRTLWYRIDEEDRDWVTFLSHLVAAGRVHDPEFAATTAALLADTGVTAATRDTVMSSFLSELPSIAEHGAVLILDDYHLVDDAPDIKLVVRELLAHAPERLTTVFSSRRQPGVPLGKLRAGGEIAELRTDDLRFDREETARLFAETYGRPLEPDVLADLTDRTEGWAASLQLVQAALRDRSPSEIRRMVRNLTGADHELYDYLAEEVVGELSEDLQDFLMRTSILQSVTPELAAFVTERTTDDVRALIAQSERLGLLSRRGETSRDSLRYHPLVVDFLRSRLERSVGSESIATMHRRIAEAHESTNWRLACHHYLAVRDDVSVARTIQRSVREIIGGGELDAAEGFLDGLRAPAHPATDVIRSRIELRRGRPGAALEMALGAYEESRSDPVVVANLASIAMMAGAYAVAKVTIEELAHNSGDAEMGSIGSGLGLLLGVTEDANLHEALAQLEALRATQQSQQQSRFQGVTCLNMASIHQAMGNAGATLAAAEDAILLLGQAGRDDEIGSAFSLRAWALAHLGDLDEARRQMATIGRDLNEFGAAEALAEAAWIEVWYGSADRARSLIERVRGFVDQQARIGLGADGAEIQLALRERDFPKATTRLVRIPSGPTFMVAFKARMMILRAETAVLLEEQGAAEALDAAIDFARHQGALHWTRYGEALRWLTRRRKGDKNAVPPADHDFSTYLSLHAESSSESLHVLTSELLVQVEEEARRRPERWLPGLRRVASGGSDASLIAARMLDRVGLRDDIPLLRSLARRHPRSEDRDLGRALARRVAPRVVVEDQGRVAIRIGDQHLEGTSIRRKVLALLCFLLTKPRFSAAREEALDALWPDAEPSVALNSLNQTVYFLRRVLEPEYREETSPGYVRHESDVLWLDRQLVSSRTQRCLDYMNSLPPMPTPEQVTSLLNLYDGPFALDFAYEDWAQAYRDSVHSAYLAIVERAVAADMASGHFERGVSTARRALKADPEAEQIEFSLLRLLRMSGAHAAAAEQYAHYSAYLRDSLGVEPPNLEDL